MAQIEKRLGRLGQKDVVTWYLLRVKQSYHDHQELSTCIKRARQIASEAEDRQLDPLSFQRHPYL